LFPDATFGGVFGAGIDLNEDIDPADGDADIFQKWPF
jgi:predicted heme/steroid binding protein